MAQIGANGWQYWRLNMKHLKPVITQDLKTITAFLLLLSLYCFLSGCKAEADETSNQSVMFQSVIEVHWTNGVQTSHSMFGPVPGDGVSFTPGPDWYYAFRGASAQSVGFYFNYPTVPVNKAVFRVVWIPNYTKIRLMVAYIDLNDRSSDIQKEVVVFDPFRKDAVVDQKVEHPLNFPRVVDVDITDAFNEATRSGRFVQFYWQVKQ